MSHVSSGANNQLGHTYLNIYKRQDYAGLSSVNGKTLYMDSAIGGYIRDIVYVLSEVEEDRRTLGSHRKDSSELHVRGFSGLWLLMEGIES